MAFKLFSFLLALALMSSVFFATNSSAFTFEKVYNGSAGKGDLPFAFNNPVSLHLGQDGLIYVCDDADSAVYALNENDSVVRTIGKKGTTSEFSNPSASWYDNGTMYVLDGGSSKLFYDIRGAGISQAITISSFLDSPSALWLEGKRMFILDKKKNKVFVYNASLDIYSGSYLSEGFGDGKLLSPSDIFFDGERFLIADTLNNRVQVFDKDFAFITAIGTGRGGLSISGPKSAASDGERIYVADTYNKRIAVFDLQGFVLDEFDEAIPGNLSFEAPVSIRLRGERLFVLDSSLGKIFEYSINWDINAQRLFSEINSANKSVQEYKEGTLSLASSAGAFYSPFDLDKKISNAYSFFAAGDYAKAKKEAVDALSQLEERKAPDNKAIESAMRAKIESAAKSAKLLNTTPLDLPTQAQLEQAAQLLADAKESLQLKNYSKCLSLTNEALAILGEAANKAAQAEQAEDAAKQQQALELEAQRLTVQAQAERVDAKLFFLNESALSLGIYIPLEPAPSLVATAHALIGVNQFADAKASLDAAELRLDKISATLNASSASINEANKKIAQASEIANKSGSAEAIAKIERARLILFDSPKTAEVFAQEAINISSSSSNFKFELDGFTLTIIIFLAVLFAIAVLGAVAFILIKSRKKGLAGATARSSDRNIQLKLDLGGRRKNGL